jgi:hypothetical protein
MRRTACGVDPVSAELHERNSGDRRVLAGRTGALKKSAKRETGMGLQSNSENESEVGGCFWEWGEGVGRDWKEVMRISVASARSSRE